MSGDIFHPMDNKEDGDTKSWNPLQCTVCKEPYSDPCILNCFHSFCERCLRGRAVDSRMTCPVCGVSTHIKEGASLPPQDPLLKFMVESSADDKAACANCDSYGNNEGMFYCNTCCQPLCAKCREDTHRAKMFASHSVVLMTKRTKEVHKRCSLHGEPYIMFSMEKKIMLCINCFRDMRIESRTHCVDLETAYNQSCKKLDHSVQAIRDLQHSVQDGVLLLRALLDEIKHNAEKERNSILELYHAIMLKMEQTKDMLVEEVDSQYHDKEKTFKGQLRGLTTLLPTLQVHLVMSLAFSSSTNKFEFLDLAYVMMDRLKTIVQRQHPLHPTQSGQIDTGHKTQFAKSLEPLLFLPQQHRSPVPGISADINRDYRVDRSAALPPNGHKNSKSPSPNPPVTNMSPVTARRSNGLNGAKVKFIDAKGPFADHCVEFETAHREVMQKFEKMKAVCQELQRDMTARRCLTKKDQIQLLEGRVETLQQQLEAHFTILDAKQAALEKHWEESYQRIANEQDLYQAQVEDVKRLKQESERLRIITTRLTSFNSTICAVSERLAPKLNQSCLSGEQDSQIMALLEEINSVQPDSQQRVDAIQVAEEERQTKSANRTNPLDSELIKTKGLLKAPSVRDRKDRRDHPGCPRDTSISPGKKDGARGKEGAAVAGAASPRGKDGVVSPRVREAGAAFSREREGPEAWSSMKEIVEGLLDPASPPRAKDPTKNDGSLVRDSGKDTTAPLPNGNVASSQSGEESPLPDGIESTFPNESAALGASYKDIVNGSADCITLPRESVSTSCTKETSTLNIMVKDVKETSLPGVKANGAREKSSSCQVNGVPFSPEKSPATANMKVEPSVVLVLPSHSANDEKTTKSVESK